MKQKIAIIGAGGLGREVLALLRSLPEQFEVMGFFDDVVPKGQRMMDVPVLGHVKNINTESVAAVIAIGDPLVKEKIAASITNPGITFPVIIHPAAIIGDTQSVKIGAGSILTAGTNLTVDIIIGKHVLINLNTTIGHNVRIGDFTSVMPGVNLAGEVQLGTGVLIGSGANVINKVTIGDKAKIGSGAVVIRDIPARATAVGVPANVIK